MVSVKILFAVNTAFQPVIELQFVIERVSEAGGRDRVAGKKKNFGIVGKKEHYIHIKNSPLENKTA